MAADIVYTLHAIIIYALLLIKECGSWPEGTYGLPMSKAGCPSTKTFEWLTGTRTQKTEPQSHSSIPIHLAGIEPDKTDRIVQNFCMKTSYPRYGNYEWGKGNYCIFKKGDCPKNFKTGWIYWDDDAPLFGTTIQGHSGTIPDGEYDRNTKIEFCCRRDGTITKPIVLPTDAPFYLFKIADSCQEVRNTAVTEEWVYWADEDFINLSGHAGIIPKLHRSKHPIKFTKLYYCYYVPQGRKSPKSYKTMMTVIYVISAIVGGFIVIFIITILVQKCCTQKATVPYEVNESEGVEQAMIEPEPSRTRSNIAAYGTEMTAIHPVRRNGAANRENEMEDYPHKRPGTGDTLPRYSQLDNAKHMPHGQGAQVVPPAEPLLEPERPTAYPPSYEEVIREKQTEDV